MRALRLLAIFVAGLAAPAGGAKVEVDVLARSGDAASDGLRLDALTTPVPSASGLLFRSGTSLLIIGHDGSRSVVLRTGDALPSPFTGTWNQFLGVDLNTSGAVAVNAQVNATDTASALVLFDGSAVVPVARDTSGRPVLNDAGNIAYLGERTESLSLWDRTSGTSMRIIARGDPTPGGTFGRVVGGPVLNASGVVAFRATEPKRRAIFLFRDGILTQVAGERRGGEVRVRLDRRQDGVLALNDDGVLAFTSGRSRSQHAVYVRQPDGVPVLVAGRRSQVGSETIDDIDTTGLAIDASGAVTFSARLRSRRTARLRAADGTLSLVTLPEEPPPAPEPIDVGPIDPGFRTTIGESSSSGAFVLGLRREGLYRLAGSGPELLMDVGAALPDGRQPLVIGPHVAVGGAIVFLGTDTDGRTFVGARRADGTLHTLAASGDPDPAGRPYGFIESIHASDDGRVLFLAVGTADARGGIYSADPATGAVVAALPFGDEAPGIAGAESFAPVTGGLVFEGTLSTEKRGVFMARGSTLRRIVPVAQEPRHGRISDIGVLAAAEGHVALSARVGVDDRSALLSYDHGMLRRIAIDGRRAPGGGVYGGTFLFAPLAVSRRDVAFLATVDDREGTVQALFLAGPRGVRRLLADGASVNDGPTVRLGGELAFTGRDIVATAALRGGAASALVQVTP